MPNDRADPSCARKECTCEVPAGQTYCSPHCANASTEALSEASESGCSCGHAQCNVERAAKGGRGSAR